MAPDGSTRTEMTYLNVMGLMGLNVAGVNQHCCQVQMQNDPVCTKKWPHTVWSGKDQFILPYRSSNKDVVRQARVHAPLET